MRTFCWQDRRAAGGPLGGRSAQREGCSAENSSEKSSRPGRKSRPAGYVLYGCYILKEQRYYLTTEDDADQRDRIGHRIGAGDAVSVVRDVEQGAQGGSARHSAADGAQGFHEIHLEQPAADEI